MPLASVCPVHGPFESRLIRLTSATNATITNSSESCPKCGRPSATVEGTFDIDAEGLVRVLAAPGWSIKALRAIQGDLEDLSETLAGEASADDRIDAILARLDQRDAELGELIRAAVAGAPRSKAHLAASALLGAVGTIVTLSDGGKLTVEAIRSVVTRFF